MATIYLLWKCLLFNFLNALSYNQYCKRFSFFGTGCSKRYPVVKLSMGSENQYYVTRTLWKGTHRMHVFFVSLFWYFFFITVLFLHNSWKTHKCTKQHETKIVQLLANLPKVNHQHEKSVAKHWKEHTRHDTKQYSCLN